MTMGVNGEIELVGLARTHAPSCKLEDPGVFTVTELSSNTH